MQRKSEAEAEELAASRAAAGPGRDAPPQPEQGARGERRAASSERGSGGDAAPGWQAGGDWAEAMDTSDGGSDGGERGGSLPPAFVRERPRPPPDAQPPTKKRRALRWIRKATATPSGDEAEQGEGGGEEAQQEASEAPPPQPLREGGGGLHIKREAGEAGRELPLLPVVQRAVQAAQAAWERQQAAAGSAVGPPALPPLALRRKPGGSRLAEGGEPPGLRSPTGKPWLQVGAIPAQPPPIAPAPAHALTALPACWAAQQARPERTAASTWQPSPAAAPLRCRSAELAGPRCACCARCAAG
jgi:hypothetical protein